MIAARLHGKHDIRVDTVEAPADLRPGEIRVRPQWCGICGSDLHEYETGGLFVPAENKPQILGHEFSAEVIEVAEDVRSVRVGDRAAILPHVFCGSCHYCIRGRQALCQTLRITGMSWPWGGLATEAVVPGYQAVRLPDDVSYEQGALLEPLASAVRGVERSGLKAGDSVLIAGAGPIGQLSVLAAVAAGAASIFVSEPNPTRRRQAGELGVTAAFDPTATDVAGELRELTGGLGVDVAVECSGAGRAFALCVEAVRAGGTVAQTAIHVGPRTVQLDELTLRDITIAGSWSFNYYETPRLLAQIAAGRLPVERIVTRRIGIRAIVAEGIEALGDPAGSELKVLVDATREAG